MSIYSLSQRTIVTAAAGSNWEIRTAATDLPRVMEIGIINVTAVAGVYGIGRPAAIGVNPTTPVTFIAEDPADPVSTVTACVGWTTTAPTLPANFFRRAITAAAIGAGILFTFPRGLKIAVSNSIVVWVIATAPVCDVWATLDQ